MMKKRYTHFVIGVLMVLFVQSSFAQQTPTEKPRKQTNLGLSSQIYPAGIILTANAEFYKNPRTSLLIRAGANFADRKDFSPYNDNEKGNGVGVTFGYRKYYMLGRSSFVAGINADVWNMWIYWKNNIDLPIQTTGKTYTLVLQPWLDAGYYYNFRSAPLRIGATLGFGREINVLTDGKDVGQGWMRSLLFHMDYSI